MVFLLDVNVLVALFDPAHVHHDPAHEWFAAEGGADGFATCPVTQNSVLRIIGNMRYPNSPGTPAVVVGLLAELRSLPGHVVLPDDSSFIQSSFIDPKRLLSSSQVTDTYLLALARAKNGQLATFDRRLVTDAVHDGSKSLHVIGR
jgi:toxin-antitoxin system PIN domain toxin